MIKKLRLHNFRTYLNAELTFSPRHLIVGRNNSGKTNLYAALRFLGASATNDLAQSLLAVPGGVWEIKNWAFSSTLVELYCECELVFENEPHLFLYELKLDVDPMILAVQTPNQQPIPRVASEQLSVRSAKFENVALLSNDGREAVMLHEESFLRGKPQNTVKTLAPRDATMLSKLYELETNKRAILFRRYLSSWFFFTFNPDQIRFGWRESQSTTRGLSVSGSTLALVLYNTKNFDESQYRRIIDRTRSIEPDLEAINFIPSEGQIPIPFVELKRRRRASWIGLSDGTLRFLALAFVSEAVRPLDGMPAPFSPLIVIEEPENGIFPGQLRAAFDLFEDSGSSGQFVFTSHSPYFINFFDAHRESVTLLRRSNERTEIERIPQANETDPDRLLLADELSMELFP